jgi:hypothetical protein
MRLPWVVIALLIAVGSTALPASAADTITKLADSGDTGELVSDVTAVGIGTRAITAMRTTGGQLKLIVWHVTFDGQLVREGDSGPAGSANKISAAAFGLTTSMVTAHRQSSGHRLRLTLWRVTTNGTISKVTDSGTQAGAVRETAVTVLPSSRVVTAVRTWSGNLKLIVWDIVDDKLVRRGDSGTQAGAVGKISIASTFPPGGSTSGPQRVVTAVQTASNLLKVIAWEITTDGNVVRKGSYTVAGLEVTHLATVNSHFNKVITVFRYPMFLVGLLVGYIFDVTADGSVQLVSGIGVDVGGKLAATRLGSSLPGVAFVTEEGNLRAFVGGANSADTAGRADPGGFAGLVAITGVNTTSTVAADPQTRFVTAKQNASGNLQVGAWQWE